MKDYILRSVYEKPETVVCRKDDVAMICDSYDGDNQYYDREEFQW